MKTIFALCMLPLLAAGSSITTAAEKGDSGPSKQQTLEFIQARLAVAPALYPDNQEEAARTAYTKLKADGSDQCVLAYQDGNTGPAYKAVSEFRIPMAKIAPGEMGIYKHDLRDNLGPEVARFSVVINATNQKKVIAHRFSFRNEPMRDRDLMDNLMISVRGDDREVQKVAKALAHLAKTCGAKEDLF